MLRKALFSIILFAAIHPFAMSQSDPEVEYRLSFPDPASHYCRVEILISNFKTTYVNFRMPVWTPGSYKVREFSRNAENFRAKDFGGDALPWNRTDKNTWRVNTETSKNVHVIYEVYCNEISVRQSYVDQYWAFIHGVSAFMRPDGFDHLPITLKISPYLNWNHVHMAAEGNGNDRFNLSNFDKLADAPIALGNFDVIPFDVQGVPHEVVMIGPGNYKREQIEEDFQRICEEAAEIIGEHPSKKYIHFIQNVDKGGGGLEHANSQTSAIPRWNYSDPEKYKSFLGLIAHEYFHLWNVKRIRPKELGPFEYDQEVYTELLWVAEGITSYFDDLILMRSGFHKEEDYLKVVENNINRLQNTEGRKKMTLAESSFTAWIKAYMPDENSGNTSISYYNKGAVVAMLLDLEILKASHGKKRLDDVMKALYQEYYKKKERGFSPEEFNKTLNEVAGKDLSKWIQSWVYSTEEIDYNKHFAHVGLQLVDQNADKNEAWLGVNSRYVDGKTMIESVVNNGPAAKAGLSAGDEIIGIENFRCEGSLAEDLKRYQAGQRVKLFYNRKGQLYQTRVELERNPAVKLAFSKLEETSEQQQKLYRIWLSLAESPAEAESSEE